MLLQHFCRYHVCEFIQIHVVSLGQILAVEVLVTLSYVELLVLLCFYVRLYCGNLSLFIPCRAAQVFWQFVVILKHI